MRLLPEVCMFFMYQRQQNKMHKMQCTKEAFVKFPQIEYSIHNAVCRALVFRLRFVSVPLSPSYWSPT